ncbi:hypothetical protein EJ08DRAFT_514408 [Tothia fuscella]|uniref:Isochorismatase-like domain-containing protein n=1 Tax=Tothia fuscella TaxID=1048955 RepID=A0A9P4U173_9PEZI|nr:hypothetical protein EJ08DRAFT_514408 [Tothia fuscella]
MFQFDSTSALTVVDMQNGYCHKDGSFARLGIRTDPTTIVPRINELLSEFRANDAVAIDMIDSNNSKIFYRCLGMPMF